MSPVIGHSLRMGLCAAMLAGCGEPPVTSGGGGDEGGGPGAIFVPAAGAISSRLGDAPPPGAYGTVVIGDPRPPAISGGTLIVLGDGRTAIAADADRDRVYVVDLEARALIA